MKKTVKSGCILSVMFAMTGPVFSQTQDTPIITDRLQPSAVVVPYGALQIENGLSGVRQGGLWTLEAPLSLIRLGVGSNTEIRVAVPDYVFDLGKNAEAPGFADFTIGMKQQLVRTARFDLSIVPALLLPTGSQARSSGGVEPSLQIPFSVALSNSWVLGAALEFAYIDESGRRNLLGGSDLYLDKEIGKGFEAFANYHGDYPGRGLPVHEVEFGATYTIHKNQQIDSFVGIGLSNAAPTVSMSIGYSVRFTHFLH